MWLVILLALLSMFCCSRNLHIISPTPSLCLCCKFCVECIHIFVCCLLNLYTVPNLLLKNCCVYVETFAIAVEELFDAKSGGELSSAKCWNFCNCCWRIIRCEIRWRICWAKRQLSELNSRAKNCYFVLLLRVSLCVVRCVGADGFVF